MVSAATFCVERRPIRLVVHLRGRFSRPWPRSGPPGAPTVSEPSAGSTGALRPIPAQMQPTPGQREGQ